MAACWLLVATASLSFAETVTDRDWWSLQSLAKPRLPDLPAEIRSRAATPVDLFILAKHQELGLAMAPEADRRTLIRRLHFDLTGLPPYPEDVEAFVKDPHPEAHARWTDRLLASPQYGERWARHWLDVVHYGDTHGYDKDKLRPHAYPYRDYVIRSFNADKPYDRFVREQIAGDVLWPDTADGIVATGFIAAGPWDFIGHAEVPEAKIDGQIARHLDRDDMVANTMNTFCSLTVQCAQCHDHKRDPVSMEDYYSLQAVFAALDRADRPFDEDPAVARQRRALEEGMAELQVKDEALAKAVDDRKDDELRALEARVTALAKHQAETSENGSPSNGFHSQFHNDPSRETWVQVDLGEELAFTRVELFPAYPTDYPDTPGFGFPLAFRIEASRDPSFRDAVTLADHAGESFPNPGTQTVRFDGDFKARFVRLNATHLWRRPDGEGHLLALAEMRVLDDDVNLSHDKLVEAGDTIDAGRWHTKFLVDGFTSRQSIASEAGDVGSGSINRELTAARKAFDEGLAAAMGPELMAERRRLEESRAALEKALAGLPEPRLVYAGTIHKGTGTFRGTGHNGGKPRPIHVLRRGDVTKPADLVGPGTVDLIPGAQDRFQLPDGHTEGERRAALAEWLVRRDNPLTWRSIVNRVWHYHFGEGFVETPNDFGRLGALPSHPELLDWLACTFRDEGQSMKAIHRLICSSAVYRQSSQGQERFKRIDSGNRYLWRMNRRKIEAEPLRDSLLWLAGKLDSTMFGPGYQDFVLEKPEHSPHYQYHQHDPDDPESHRRAVYRFLVRSQPQPFMNSLDCADPSMSVARRDETMTALQALTLLNNRFVMRMSEHFADRLARERDTTEGQVSRAYELALGRAPTPEEQSAFSAYVREHGLPAACRLLVNLNEFVFVD